MKVYLTLIYVVDLLVCVFGADEVTVMEGESVTLHTDVTKQQRDKMQWYFNNTRIALINGHPNTSCLYDGEGGRFRGRLDVDYETGSLIITDIRSEHAGRYELDTIRSETSGTSISLNRNPKCDSTNIIRKTSTTHDDTIKIFNLNLTTTTKQNYPEKSGTAGMKQDPVKNVPGSGQSSGDVAGIVVGVLLLVVFGAAGVIYYRHRRSKNDELMKRNSDDPVFRPINEIEGLNRTEV